MPPIVDTIFNKIDAATIFVPDLTFVGKRIDPRRPTPNRYVLVGIWVGIQSLDLVAARSGMNVAFGQPTPEAFGSASDWEGGAGRAPLPEG